MGYKVRVTGTIGAEKYLSTLEANGNEIISDEPQEFGGQNKGLNPFELLASGLSSCTLVTLKSYIDSKGWDIPGISVVVELENFPKEKKAVFKKYIDFKGAELTENQQKRLFQIAEKCPVHTLLSNSIDIFSEIKSV